MYLLRYMRIIVLTWNLFGGASEIVGKVISKGSIVVYESTVYPGVTEEEYLLVVEKVSGLKFNEDFFAGYSTRAY